MKETGEGAPLWDSVMQDRRLAKNHPDLVAVGRARDRQAAKLESIREILERVHVRDHGAGMTFADCPDCADARELINQFEVAISRADDFMANYKQEHGLV